MFNARHHAPSNRICQSVINFPASRKMLVVPGLLLISRFLQQLLIRDTSSVARSRMKKTPIRLLFSLIMVCDVKTISNDGAIVERLVSRDISIEQEKRPHNAGKRHGSVRCRQDLIGREGYTKEATEQCRKTSIDNTRSHRQDLIGLEAYTKRSTEQCRKTSIENARGSRQWGDGSVTSRYTGRDGE